MPELYRTAAGSEVVVTEHVVETSFHWHDEGAHLGVRLEVDLRNPDSLWLHWECACCEPGEARLVRVVEGAPER